MLESATDSVDSLDSQAELARALGQLPALTRYVVWLHDVEGFTHSEIGRMLGRTTSFSKSQLARAHVRLREQLETNRSVPLVSSHRALNEDASIQRSGDAVGGETASTRLVIARE